MTRGIRTPADPAAIRCSAGSRPATRQPRTDHRVGGIRETEVVSQRVVDLLADRVEDRLGRSALDKLNGLFVGTLNRVDRLEIVFGGTPVTTTALDTSAIREPVRDGDDLIPPTHRDSTTSRYRLMRVDNRPGSRSDFICSMTATEAPSVART